MGSLPADSEQFMLIEDLYKTTEKLTINQEMNTSNKLRIEFMEKQISKMLDDIEKLKDQNTNSGTKIVPEFVFILERHI